MAARLIFLTTLCMTLPCTETHKSSGFFFFGLPKETRVNSLAFQCHLVLVSAHLRDSSSTATVRNHAVCPEHLMHNLLILFVGVVAKA